MPSKITDSLAALPPGSVHFEGRLGEKTAELIRNSVDAQDIGRLLQPFRTKTETGDGDWRCEYWGKWATGAALAWAVHPSAARARELLRAASELLATQEPDGYIGTRRPEYRLAGWDVWGRKYVLLGLLGIFDATGEQVVLEAARRQADCLIAECGSGKANITELGLPLWKGLPPSSLLEPIVLLHARTGERKYLAFAEHIVAQWSCPNRWSPRGLRLIEDALAGMPIAALGGAPKAYEMMSCYEGLCELFRATGNRTYLNAVRNFAAGVFDQELTLIGSGSHEEIWCGGRNKQCSEPVLAMETCVTATWMKLCFQLLRLSGDPRYADALETSLYNALLGALAPEGQWWGYLSSLAGDRVPSHRQHDDVGTSCCVLNGPRAFLLTPRWAVMRAEQGPVVNLYNAGWSEIPLDSGNSVRLLQDTNYPVGGQIRLQVNPAHPAVFTLSLRIPGWSMASAITINGKNAGIISQPGSYARVRREWHRGDQVELNLDLRGRMIQAPAHANFFALAHGPLVLALDNRLCPSQPLTALEPARIPEFGMPANLAAAEKIGAWLAVDQVFTDPTGQRHQLTFCDFASAGNGWTEQSLYRVWLARPLDLTAIWQNAAPRCWQAFTQTRPELPSAPIPRPGCGTTAFA